MSQRTSGTSQSVINQDRRKASRAYRAQQLRKRQRQRQLRIAATILMLLLLILIVSVIGIFFFFRHSGSLDSFVMPFSSAVELKAGSGIMDNLRADTFADSLCVIGQDVSNEGIPELPAGQQGVLLDVNQHKTLYAKGAFVRVYPASITKLVTSIMALEYGNMSDVVTIKQEDLNLEEAAQVCGFIPGDQLTMSQLLHCLLVYSGNDAAMAIADHIGGSISGFVDLMNEYARSLGCTGTHFVNPHGLHDPDHYTTPYDIYLILKEAAKYPEFTSISQLPSYTVEYYRSDGTYMKTELLATDHYLTGEATLPKDVTVLGGKTGTTSNAGNCLALLTSNAYGRPFVSIVMGASSKELLYEQMNNLLMVINQ